MATGGKRPKPTHLRLVDGTHRPSRHGPEDEATRAVTSAAQQFGTMVRPKYLKGEALAAWKRYIEPATWLDASRGPAAIAFCELWREFKHAPMQFPASKHAQMRAYLADLGLTDERNRPVQPAETDEFFDG